MRFIHIFLISISLFIIGCGGENSKENTQTPQVTIKVGSEGAYKPFSYVDKDGKITGYDVEVLRLLQEIDSTLSFDFNYAPWNSLFLGLDSARFDMLANQIIKTKEREERYLLNNNSYFVSTSQFITRSNDNTINSTNDFKGKIAGGVVGSAHTKILEDWNNKNGKILEIRYYKDLSPLLQDLVNKRIDVHLNDPASIIDIVREQNLALKILDERISQSNVYFIFRKEDKSKELIDKIDTALQKAKDSGKLSELSIRFFGIDQSK
ncbi:L-cystine-binding protein tcyA [Helicobacter sp. 16-1353]|uniref:transporter substrate-binding domain-containing protein n=1 Tax=Helicobacter sp. 16-1353 TaxID=2004996 RepID=UPI000DCE90BF|nr:transporter substrate-binding domain-containing protein [Helicobacter sp. 16-1353]RAX54379.1 L-cystine-binding protein tcyA [Helicobacter sp. 16-1353]